MNTVVTSREAILATCRDLISEKGLASLNMRAVASACGLALGSIYYYFPSKNDLLIAAIESVWEDIFRLKEAGKDETSFPEYIAKCFQQIRKGIEKYPNFFTIHSISLSSNAQDKARNSMDHYLGKVREQILASIRKDARIKETAFTNGLEEDEFLDFVISNMISFLVQKRSDCRVLVEVIKRTIY